MKTYFKNTHLFFLINTTTTENNIRTRQKLTKLHLESYKFCNNLTRQLLKRSLFSNYLPLIKGTMKLMKYININDFQVKLYLKKTILLSVVLNNKLYLFKYINK